MPNTLLLAHSEQFKKSVIELAPGIYSAVGFAASNAHMVEGKTSVTIIDTTESTAAAENILAEFRKHSDKPVGRIIYTHSHRDHISGAAVFSPQNNVPVLASAGFKSDLVGVDESAIAPNHALAQRTQAQFGIGLAAEQRISLGCGPGDRPMRGLGAGFLEPTELISGNIDIDLDGVAAQLIMAPGETDDHMVVWLPESRVLFSGDNWYHSFPNLYAIRGTAYRDYATWAQSLGLLADLHPEVMAPGHTMPVVGHEKIQEVLATTRAAIEHVMQFTANGMNAGLSADDIADSIRLPAELADKPWLGEFYGKLSWSTRAFASGTLGWYDGNATHLGTLSTLKRAQHLSHLAGGVEALAATARATTDLQWRLELCDHLNALGFDARLLKAEAMELLADDEINATARNTYLWQARQIRTQLQSELNDAD